MQSLKITMPSTNIKIEPQLRDSITTSGTQLQSTVTLTNKLQPVPTTDQHCNFLGVPVMEAVMFHQKHGCARLCVMGLVSPEP